MASRVEVNYKGAIEFLQRKKATADLAAERIVTRGALIVEAQAKKEFRPRPLGSRRVSRTGRVYYAGAPNYPAEPPRPTSRTGNLQASIGTRYIRRNGYAKWESGVGPNMKYGPFVEYGTSRARAFPFMEPGFEKSKDKLMELARKEWEAVTL